jgi:nitrous oxide reductase accessory protein NosL
MKKLILAIVATGAVLAACGGADNGNAPAAASGSSGATAAFHAPAISAVGQTMTNGAKQTVTVVSFKRGVPPDQYMTATAGQEGLQVNLSLVNGDSSPWTLPLYEIAVVDANGQSHSVDIGTYGTSSSVDALVSGGKAQATMFFEVPVGSALLLTWTPSALNPNSTFQTALK